MARIAGVDVPRDKRIEVALTYIFGIGPATSRRLLVIAQIPPGVRARDLTDAQVGKLRDVIAKQLQGPEQPAEETLTAPPLPPAPPTPLLPPAPPPP